MKANWWTIPPYTNQSNAGQGGIFFDVVTTMINSMCGTCKNGHGKTELCYSSNCNQGSRRRREVNTNEKTSFAGVLQNINSEVDISFPIQGNKYMTTYGGTYSYISIVETPGSCFFTVKVVPSTSEIFVNSAIKSIPFGIMIGLLSAAAGIVIWALVSNHS